MRCAAVVMEDHRQGLDAIDEVAARWDQVVVAVWPFEVEEPEKFKVNGFNRTENDDKLDPINYIAEKDLENELSWVVGDTYGIAPIQTIDTDGALLGEDGKIVPLTYILKNAPPGTFISSSTGEISGVPRAATDGKAVDVDVYAVDGDGAQDKFATFKIKVSNPKQFVVQKDKSGSRTESGKLYTDPKDVKEGFFVNENYVIAPPQIDLGATVLSSGSTDENDKKKITYKLRGEPSSWFVSGASGIITGQFNSTGNYTFTLVAIDDRGEESDLDTLRFIVIKPDAFEVVGYDKIPSPARPDLEEKDYTDPATTTTYAVGDTYRFRAIDISETKYTIDAPSDITFTLENPPQGFLVDTKDGYIQGTPTTTGNYNMKIYAVDSRKERALIETLELEVKRKDTDVPEYGPNGAGCDHGETVDETLFDSKFACDCAGTVYTGENCEQMSTQGSKLIIVPTTNRLNNGAGYTDPTTKKTSYFVGENYLIARLQLNETATVVTQGGVNQITYTLRGAPDSWFINADTGEMTGRFREEKSYTFSIDGIDLGRKQKEIESFSFKVVKPEAFKVLGYDRIPSPARNFSSKDYTDPSSASMVYAVGDIYRFGAIDITGLENTEDDASEITFT